MFTPLGPLATAKPWSFYISSLRLFQNVSSLNCVVCRLLLPSNTHIFLLCHHVFSWLGNSVLMSHVCHSLPTHLQEDILVAAKFWWLWMNYGHLRAGLFSFIRITFNSLNKCRGVQFLNNRWRFCFVRICQSVLCSGCTILTSLPPGVSFGCSASSAFMLLVVHPDAITVVSCAVPSGQELLVKFSCSFLPSVSLLC